MGQHAKHEATACVFQCAVRLQVGFLGCWLVGGTTLGLDVR